MKNILVVDDNKTSLLSAKQALDKIYKVTAVTSGEQALKFIEIKTCDMILLDINMPDMDGFATMENIRAHANGADVPIIFLTADNDAETEKKGLELGAADFIAKPFVPEVMLARINRIIELSDLQRNLEEKLEKRTKHISRIRHKMVLGMAAMVESRDNSTGGHIKRTSAVVEIFADRLLKNGYPVTEKFLDSVVKAAPMHDLGKIAVGDRILRKQGKFTEEEYGEMKKHSEEGARIIRTILENIEKKDFVDVAVNVAHFHHEKWNGTGYPTGISGENIPTEARIMALADVFDALVSKRCYKEAFTYDEAFSIIEKDLGSHFDPELGKIFISCRPELEEYYNNMQQ